MRVKMELQGTTALMMHNVRLADPQDVFTKQIASFTAKKKNQTESDKEWISKLEWYGGLYTDDSGNVAIQSSAIVGCLKEAGAITRSGTKILRGITPYSLLTPLTLPGGLKHKDELWGKTEYLDRRAVKIGRQTILRTRPIFHRWAAAIEFELLDDVINFDDFVEITDKAGRAIGIGDGRRIGHGRFTSQVVVAAMQKLAA